MNDDQLDKESKRKKALAFAMLFAIRGCEIRSLYEAPKPSADVIKWRDEAIVFIADCLCAGREFNAIDAQALLDRSPVEIRRGGY